MLAFGKCLSTVRSTRGTSKGKGGAVSRHPTHLALATIFGKEGRRNGRLPTAPKYGRASRRNKPVIVYPELISPFVHIGWGQGSSALVGYRVNRRGYGTKGTHIFLALAPLTHIACRFTWCLWHCYIPMLELSTAPDVTLRFIPVHHGAQMEEHMLLVSSCRARLMSKSRVLLLRKTRNKPSKWAVEYVRFSRPII